MLVMTAEAPVTDSSAMSFKTALLREVVLSGLAHGRELKWCQCRRIRGVCPASTLHPHENTSHESKHAAWQLVSITMQTT